MYYKESSKSCYHSSNTSESSETMSIGNHSATIKPQEGYLELIIGPMFSGKTSKLLEVYKQCIFCNIPVVVINYSGDNRYSETMLSTHDKQMIPCIKGITLSEIMINYRAEIVLAEVVLINEGQFFKDIEIVRHLVDVEQKRVYICGLDGDFERKPIGKLLNLIPFCNEVYKLKSLCSRCKNGKFAIFTYRLSNERDQVVIGVDNYIPVCRDCHIELSAARDSPQL